MNTLHTLRKRLLVYLAAVMVVALFHFGGGIPLPGALLLGVALTITTLWIYGLWEIAAHKPYRLTIGIKYNSIWEDFELAPADGPKFQNHTFTAISATLYSRSDDREYSSKLDLYQRIPCAKAVWIPAVGEIDNVPIFFFRPIKDGYQFGLKVQEEWWKTHRSQLDSGLSQKNLADDGTVTLGMLPYGFIPEHVRRWNEPVSLWYPFDRKNKQWNARLQKHGWELNENFPSRIEHRYVTLWYHDI